MSYFPLPESYSTNMYIIKVNKTEKKKPNGNFFILRRNPAVNSGNCAHKAVDFPKRFVRLNGLLDVISKTIQQNITYGHGIFNVSLTFILF